MKIKNTTSFKIENEIHTHEETLRFQLVPHFVQSLNIRLAINSFGLRQSASCRPEFIQIFPYGKTSHTPNIKLNNPQEIKQGGNP